MAECTNPIYVDTTNVLNFGFSTTFNPYTKAVTFDISGYTEFKTGGEANITAINFEVTDPQENVYTGTINPSDDETTLTITGLVAGLLYFGEYHVKGTLVEADASTEEIEFDIEICDNNLLTATNYIKGCINAEANCLTAKLTITDQNAYYYNGYTALDEKDFDAKMWLPNDPDGGLEEFVLPYIPYVKNLSGYYTGVYQISVTSIAYYELDCGVKLAITYKSSLTKTVDCTASICELNCCWADANAVVKNGGQKGGQMEQKLADAQPYYLEAMGNYICGKNAQKAIDMVNQILSCDCSCRQYIIQPAPITLGNANVTGECGTSVSVTEAGDISIHSFVYQVVKGNPLDLAFIFTTTQPNDCTKRTTITFNYDVMQQYILNAIAGNQTFIDNWREVLGIKDCPCDGVEMTNEPELLNVLKYVADFYSLEPTYFVKNDIITGIQYKDHSAVSGGVFDFTEYYDQLISQGGILQTAGDNITLPCLVCGEALAGLSGYQLTTQIHSTCACIELTTCDLDTPYVDYSERYVSANRMNPQIEDYPVVTSSELIDGDIYTIQKFYYSEIGTYCCIRYIAFKTDNVGNTTLHEVRTVIGANTGSITNPTINNTWGNSVNINRSSSINLDFLEIVNGSPVMYFVTFGGYCCRAVRERSGECDERANWKVYVIASPTVDCHGMKKWLVDANGNQTLIYVRSSTNKLILLTFDNTGSKNDSANWTETDIQVSCPNDFNIEITKRYLFVFGTSLVKLSIYSGTTSLTDLMTPANYAEYNLCSNASASETSYLDGFGTVATIANPFWMQKVTVGAEERYYFGNESTDQSNNYIKYSYMRYMVYRGDDPTLPASWEFHTEIVVSNITILGDGTYNAGVSTNVNGASQGLVYIDDLGWVSLFVYGVKIIDFDNETMTIFSGQEVLNGDLVIDNFMDTQYAYQLSNCEGGSGD